MEILNKILLIVVSVVILFESSVQSFHWNNLINKTQNWSKNYSNDWKTTLLTISAQKRISVACNESLWQTLAGIQDLDVWAIEMINSWGSFPPNGLIIGTSTDFGSYDQCLDIEPNDAIGKPQYCLIDVRPPLPKPMPVHHNLHHQLDVLPIGFNKTGNVFEVYSEFASFFYWLSLRTGICTPSKCTQEDIRSLAEGFTENYGLEFRQSRCETKTETELSFIQIIALYEFY